MSVVRRHRGLQQRLCSDNFRRPSLSEADGRTLGAPGTDADSPDELVRHQLDGHAVAAGKNDALGQAGAV
jgi:hypothetical protein